MAEVESDDRNDVTLVRFLIVVGIQFVGAALVIAFANDATAIVAISVTQLIYLAPAYIMFRRKGETGLARACVMVAGLTFLLNAACFGIALVSLSGLH